MNRRDFLKRSALVAIPAIVPVWGHAARISGAPDHATLPPSSRIVVGFVGVGGKGTGNLKDFMNDPRVQIAAVCDVDSTHAANAAQVVAAKVGKPCRTTGDFRDLTRDPAIDVIVVCTPDHWHTLVAMDAVRHGKDCYVEKPMTLTIAEGRALSDETHRLNRIIQVGSQQRTFGEFRRVNELVMNGYIGTLRSIEIMIPANNVPSPTPWTPEAPPPEFDYNFWLGQAPWEPYQPKRCHYSFRYMQDYSGGQVTNWGTHYIDIAQWCMGMDSSGPIAVEGRGTFPYEGLFDVPTEVDFTCTYASGVKLRCHTRHDGIYDGTITFHGDDGWIFVNRDGVKASRPDLIRAEVKSTEKHLEHNLSSHLGNLLDCVVSRRQPIAPVEAGHRSATVCHLGNIAMRLGRPLKWDPETESFPQDEEANRLRNRSMRSPWTL